MKTQILMLICALSTSTAFARGGSSTVGTGAPQFYVTCKGSGDFEVSLAKIMSDTDTSQLQLTAISQQQQYMESYPAAQIPPKQNLVGAPLQYESAAHVLEFNMTVAPHFNDKGQLLVPGKLIFKNQKRTESLECVVIEIPQN